MKLTFNTSDIKTYVEASIFTSWWKNLTNGLQLLSGCKFIYYLLIFLLSSTYLQRTNLGQKYSQTEGCTFAFIEFMISHQRTRKKSHLHTVIVCTVQETKWDGKLCNGGSLTPYNLWRAREGKPELERGMGNGNSTWLSIENQVGFLEEMLTHRS